MRWVSFERGLGVYVFPHGAGDMDFFSLRGVHA
jgi:hypothetical protein